MSVSTKLQLPLLAAAQAQKHVTVNEALLRLDALTQATVLSRAVAAEPASPSDGDLYILPPGKTGTHWGPMANYALAQYRDGIWEQIAPRAGWIAFIVDEALMVYYAGAAWASLSANLGAQPAGHLFGLTLSNNAADATNDIDIAAGIARSADDATDLVLAAALTKRLDASWAVGPAQGGLDSGSKANSTWYHVWLIKRPDTGLVDALFSTSASAPTMPTNYTKKRRLGAVRTNGSGAILAFSQHGDEFLLAASVLDVSATNPGTTAAARTLTVPTGVKVQALINFNTINNGAASVLTLISEIDRNDEAPAYTTAPLKSSGNAMNASGGDNNIGDRMRIRTNTSGQVRSRLSASSSDVILLIATFGWIDDRGRAAA